MAQYISKSALVAEIERMQDAYIAKLESRGMGHEEAVMASISYVNGIKDAINSLEVKEVDLEKYYHDFLQKEWFGKNCNRTISEMIAFTAKHFFEFGMSVSNKAQKGE